ncbi:FixH family protein [Myroides marinus]|uniref:FixH protein n=1 Tax=Myroides marinus TaxID=703342 RepID=A0A1H6VX56_9FLAO|nr:FixH family protein [Myroides marinus]MDM1345818.1 FixH family protein [Myroides marinus]MDM1349321.1 FixH family protein [Myroides marinus]MDM1353001.1 FixH family protein [Myroides marinus]MDM1356531.1 FixH family protein [Myroides marinus]MDM1360891.1 FixH family protein [Myroides marinus]
MKFNFGTGIVIAMGLFMVFILQYVIRVQMDKKFDNELVTENYYQQEIEVDGRHDREVAALKLDKKLTIETTKSGDISIVFPSDFDAKNITGKIFLYRPSNQRLDFDMPISLSSSNLLIPNNTLVDGRWDIAVEWSYDGADYRNKQSLTVKKD